MARSRFPERHHTPDQAELHRLREENRRLLICAAGGAMFLFRMFHGILMGQRDASAPQKFERVLQGVRSSKKLWSHPEE